MVYEGVTGDYSKSQDWFGTQLGTTTAESSSANIATVLKNYTGKNYSRTAVSGMSLTTMYNNIWFSLSNKCAIVASVSNIPGLGYTTAGHFIVITSSERWVTTGTIQYGYNDPHYNNAYFGQYWAGQSDMKTAAVT